MMSKIGLFPAAGRLGTSIYTHLLKIVDPAQVILISRKPETIASEHALNVAATRKANYDDLESLKMAFNGITYLILISYPSLEFEHRVKVHRSAIDAAIASGVSHIFYTSVALGGDCKPSSVAHIMQVHLSTEAYLQSLAKEKPGFSFTAIREGVYSECFTMYTGFPDLRNPDDKVKIPLKGAGPGIAFAKIDNLGEATAKLVQSYVNGGDVNEYRNQTVLLSGPKAYSIAETVDILGSIKGKEITIEETSVDDYANDANVQGNLGSGDVARKWATSFEAIKNGETAVTSSLLGKLLEKQPERFEETVKSMADLAERT